MSALYFNATPARKIAILEWVKRGADPTDEAAVPFGNLRDMERDDLVSLTAYRSGDGTRLIVTLDPGGEFEHARLKAIEARPCRDCNATPCDCIPFLTMSDCTCQYDRERKAYVHVCTFHAPAIELHRHLDAEDRWMLAGREVTHEAAVEHEPLRAAFDKALAPFGRLMVPGPRHGRTYAAGSAEHVRALGQSLDANVGTRDMPKRRVHGGPLSGFDNLRIRRRRR